MSKILNVTNPEDNSLVGTMELTSEEELESMVDKAYAARRKWRDTPIRQRADILNKFSELISTKYTKELAELSTRELGKPITQSYEECGEVADIIKNTTERALHLYGDVLTESAPELENDLIYTKREPLGVVACITPFNFPMELTVHKIAPALVMGNTVIVKAPSSNPLAVMKLGEILQEAGIPEDVAFFMNCDHEAYSKKISKNPKVEAICLTGSTDTGIGLAKDAAETLKTLLFELGGNDGLIVFDDADFDQVLEEMFLGRIYNNGQVCCATKRLIVQNSIKDKLAEKLADWTKEFNIASAMDPDAIITTLISEKDALMVEERIKKTIEQGAVCVCGGKREGARIIPTVLNNVTKDMDIAKNMEVFGPVIPIIGFDTEDEAVEIINNTKYGLSSGIITADLKRAYRVSNYIESGATVLNGTGHYRHYDQAFGGFKSSGLGREGISVSVEEYSQLKTYVLKGVLGR
ncbi:MAG: aldehyde dehydrogenase family protein [Eubacteriaceae bacterium]|jgi:succinate-semialdehyde dehydrogenase/glutarate-semialdehyde dehydrogenase|nr:aldehyde dehydrogenase family protein [Eubacteriaceae bacterium]